jgi:phenylalanyl-tRNA synthetase alpha chain
LVTKAIREITKTFERIGFYRVRYPEVEWDWYAFEALNMPPDHPARDEWETFFIDREPVGPKGRRILTPHTSSGQLREMERKELPIRMVNISTCYRREINLTHVPMFHQFEGLVIDEGITIAHLKGVLDYFVKNFFGPDREVRIRPFHFQFTEPSFEIDISCGLCHGKGCRMCKRGWLELGGAGMVHPNVLKAGKIDSKKYSGFAFGWGVERSYMMKSGLQIPDIRMLYQSDIRFLRQF